MNVLSLLMSLRPGACLEAGVEVDADALGMVEGADALGVVGADAAAEQEGRLAVVGFKNAPVELFAAAADQRRLRVEEQVVGRAVVVGGALQVGGRGDAEGLDEALNMPGRMSASSVRRRLRMRSAGVSWPCSWMASRR